MGPKGPVKTTGMVGDCDLQSILQHLKQCSTALQAAITAALMLQP